MKFKAFFFKQSEEIIIKKVRTLVIQGDVHQGGSQRELLNYRQSFPNLDTVCTGAHFNLII